MKLSEEEEELTSYKISRLEMVKMEYSGRLLDICDQFINLGLVYAGYLFAFSTKNKPIARTKKEV